MTENKPKVVYSTRPAPTLPEPAEGSGSAGSPHAGPPAKQQTIHVVLDTKRRKGKTVTILRGFQLRPGPLKELEQAFKRLCAAGGRSEAGEIELQGDQREKVIAHLRSLGYKTKP